MCLSEDGDVQAELLIVDFEQEDSSRKTYLDIIYGLKLSLPEFMYLAEPLMFTVRSDPSPPWAPHSDLQVPFHITQDAKMFVASLWVRNRALVDHLTLVIPQSTLLSRLDLLGPMTAPPLDWEAWGPAGSRMTKLYTPNVAFDSWACYVYGTKLIVPEHSSRTNNEFIVQVFDFNLNAVRRAVSQDANVNVYPCPTDTSVTHLECDKSLCITAPTVFKAGDVFKEEVKTCLPYRWIAKVIPSTRSECSTMCSEDSIIVVDVSAITLNHHPQTNPPLTM